MVAAIWTRYLLNHQSPVVTLSWILHPTGSVDFLVVVTTIVGGFQGQKFIRNTIMLEGQEKEQIDFQFFFFFLSEWTWSVPRCVYTTTFKSAERGFAARSKDT